MSLVPVGRPASIYTKRAISAIMFRRESLKFFTSGRIKEEDEWIGRDVEESCRFLVRGTVPAFSWKDRHQNKLRIWSCRSSRG
jgi:hypothetical protein